MDRPILRLDRQSLPRPHSSTAAVQSPSAARVALEITRGRVQQRIRPIAGKVFLIGAASDCDLVLGDLQFPEAYAYVFVSGCRVSIRRLGTGPELLVCGEPAESAELFHGDLVELGPFELRVLIEDAPRGGSRLDDGREPTSAVARGMEAETAAAVHEVRVLLMEVRRQLAGEPPVLRLYHDEAETADSELARRVSA
jgi:hypothetical protein